MLYLVRITWPGLVATAARLGSFVRAWSCPLGSAWVSLALWGAEAPGPVPAPGQAVRPGALATLIVGNSEAVPDWVANRQQCQVGNLEGQPCLEIQGDKNPYRQVEWKIRWPVLAQPADGPVVVEVQFVDHGAGVIEPTWVGADAPAKRGVHPSRRSCYTRLNTGRVRRGWFEFPRSVAANQTTNGAKLQVTGLQYLRGIRVLPAQPEAAWTVLHAERPREVRPMVTLKHPMELVTTAGVDVTGDLSTLNASLEALAELAPLARVLGFTSIESYVTWKRLEPQREGAFDFRFYDAIVQKLAEHKLKWFPLLIVGSGYALPDWFLSSPENVGFVCLEHGRSNVVQSIWSPTHRRHVTRVLQAFGRHYEPMGVLEGVRLGPSGNYGESQYPASGNWGPRNTPMHIHIGWWAGDAYGQADFRHWAERKYQTLNALNQAWQAELARFDEVKPVLPVTMLSRRQRLDFTAWYTDSMSDWCGWWAQEARRALPHTPIYQSAGGWGLRETGTDYSAQTKAMVDIEGGVRLTNETDSYEQNFCVTRLAATAARLYGVRLGYEPASSHTARGVVGRIFHTTATKGDHLFTYHGNIFNHQLSIAKWLKYVPVLDTRQDSLLEVAVYYPETENQLNDGAFRHLYAWGFYPLARETRRVIDVDYLDERLIREGFLERYKVLVFAWGNQIEADVQRTIDQWLRAGGVIIYPSYPRGAQETIEGRTDVFQRWSNGDTERGSFHRFPGDMEPPSGYGNFVRSVLRSVTTLHPWTRKALEAKHPEQVFLAVQQDGHLLALNYHDEPARVSLEGQFDEVIEPYGIRRMALER
jgi:hypothetical protein